MKKKKILVLSALLLGSTISLSSCGESAKPGDGIPEDNKPNTDELVNNHDPFDYPGNFEAPELLVDGIRDELYNTKGSQTLYIDKGSEHELSATFYRGEKALFAYFEVKDNNILSYGDSAGDDVTHGDSIEFYLDTKNDGGKRPQTDDFQFNFGVHNKTRIMQGSGYEWGNWSGLVQYENIVNGTLNNKDDVDTGWNCEVMVPYKELGITKDSILGVALGRVDKFGQGNAVETDWKWYGLTFEGLFVEPQTINNYISLVGNKFYKRENVPLIKTVSGVVKDSAGNVLADVKVKSGTLESTTDATGKFTFLNYSFLNDNEFIFTKEGYVSRTIKITKVEAQEFENDVVIEDVVLSNENQETKTTFKGSIKNIKNGLLEGVTVKFGTLETKTTKNGEFSLDVSFKGEAKIEFIKDGYNSKSIVVDGVNIVPNGETNIGVIGLDLEYSIFNFAGQREVPSVTGGVTRTLEGVKFKFSSTTEIKEGNFIEFWIDTKTSGQSRDNTDYTFKFNFDGGVIEAKNMGSGKELDMSKIKSSQYKDQDSFVIEVEMDYGLLGVQAGEIIGMSAGVFFNGDWDGWTYNEQYVAPEIPTKYVRIGVNNELYMANNNIGGDVDPYAYKNLGEFGAKFGGFVTEVTRDVEDGLFVKITSKENWDNQLKLEFYIDTNKAPTEQRETHSFRMDLWGNGDVSLFGNYKGVADEMNDLTATTKDKIITSVNGKILTFKIPYSILNVSNNATIGISQGIWNETKKDWDGWGYEQDGYNGFIAPEKPNCYVRINSKNEVTKDTLTYLDLGTVGGKSKGETHMSTLKMKMSRQEENSLLLDITNETYKFEDSRNGKENLEFYFDFGDKARCGEAITKPGNNFRDEKTFKVFISPNGTLGFVENYPAGRPARVSEELFKLFTVNKVADNRIQLIINFEGLNIIQDKTIGFSCGVWNEDIKDWSPYNFGKERRVENAGQYLRIDSAGNALAD